MIHANNNILDLPLDEGKLWKDFKFFSNKELDYSAFHDTKFISNYIIRYFQQDIFYRTEKELWKASRDLREQLIANRCMHLNKNQEDLTVADMLAAFKISGIYYGYSHFNPLWFKWFIGRYNAKICYDPCGGWGHRLLGATNLNLYLYNDKSQTTKCNVDTIIKYFNIENAITSCNDARYFVPNAEFDSMFTCPPYFNLEQYECESFKNEKDYIDFVNSIFMIFNGKKSCKIFGLVTRDDMLYGHTDYAEKFLLNAQNSHLVTTRKKIHEYLFIYKK